MRVRYKVCLDTQRGGRRRGGEKMWKKGKKEGTKDGESLYG